MKIKKHNILTLLLLLSIILFPLSSTEAYTPIMASRISNITEILADISGPYQPNSTLFSIEVEVEILNRDYGYQKIIEFTDLNSDVFINASFTNQSYQLEQILYGPAVISRHSYVSGITVEYDLLEFYINQADLNQLPDGNYTLWRPFMIELSDGNYSEGESLSTFISVANGTNEITYPIFTDIPTPTSNNNTTDNPTDTTNLPIIEIFAALSLLSCASIGSRRKFRKKKRTQLSKD